MFLQYIQSFRGIAIAYIVAGHCISIFNWDNAENLERWLKIIFGNGTALFVFIAGYLFQYLAKNYTKKKYFLSKLKNVISPYIVISIPGIYFSIFILHRYTVWDGFYSSPVWEQVIYFYITGLHVTPLWFIPMITLFYIVSPLLVLADRNKKIYYLLPVFITVSCFVSRGGYYAYISFIHFFSVYLLGMFCCRNRDKINACLSKIWVLSVIALIVVLFIVLEYYYMQGTMTWVNFLGKIFLCFFYIGLLVRLEGKFNDRVLVILANVSFGIYFVHSYYITSLKMLTKSYWNGNIHGGVPELILSTIVVLLTCSLTVWLIKKMFGKKSRFVIGS